MTMLLGRKQLLINGEWRDGGGKPISVINPATEEIIAEVARAVIQSLQDKH